MIELVMNWLEGLADICKVYYPASCCAHFPTDMNCNMERMAMQSATFATSGNLRQEMCGTESKFLKDFHPSLLLDSVTDIS